MPEHGEVVIIGGGAAGCAVAYYLGVAGVKATLIERGGIGRQASGFSAGGLNPLQGLSAVMQPLAMTAYSMHLALWDTLRQRLGHDYQGRLIALLQGCFDEAQLPALQAELQLFEATPGFSGHWLDRAALRQLEPRLNPSLLGAAYLYGNGIVDSHLYTVALAEAAQHYGATLRAGTVRGFQHAQGRVTGVLLEDGTLSCETVVLALGPWSSEMAAGLHLAVPLRPLKGEILRLELEGPALAHDVATSEVHLFSRGNQVWCGSTEEDCGFDTTPSATARRSLLARAAHVLPAVASATLLQHTACLRPVTPDGLPIIGQAPQWDNVYLATGGGKKGILFSPVLGQAIADLITTGHTGLDIAPCTPQRFATVPA